MEWKTRWGMARKGYFEANRGESSRVLVYQLSSKWDLLRNFRKSFVGPRAFAQNVEVLLSTFSVNCNSLCGCVLLICSPGQASTRLSFTFYMFPPQLKYDLKTWPCSCLCANLCTYEASFIVRSNVALKSSNGFAHTDFV
jgi:hypothetical protein